MRHGSTAASLIAMSATALWLGLWPAVEASGAGRFPAAPAGSASCCAAQAAETDPCCCCPVGDDAGSGRCSGPAPWSTCRCACAGAVIVYLAAGDPAVEPGRSPGSWIDDHQERGASRAIRPPVPPPDA